MDKQLEDILISYKDYLNKIPNGCALITTYFREGKNEAGKKFIFDLAEGLNWMNEVNRIALQNNIVLNFKVSQINDLLKEVNEALQNEDYVLIADLFEYEFLPFFEQYVEEVQGNEM